MKKALFLSFFLTPFVSLYAQNSVSGTRQQLIKEILSLRQENADLKLQLDQNSIALSDTITANDTLNYGNLYTDYRDFMDEIEMPVNTDSLLSLFYLQRSLHLNNQEDDFLDIDSINVVADLPDSVYISRLKALNSVITLPYNPTVRNSIVYYTQKMPEKIATILGLASYYMPIFEEIFDQNDLPLELKAMAVIESALNPTAVSRAKARGMWQFMLVTGKQYGLKIDSYVDERYDPITSGHAAARYLKDAYTMFGDWPLAIASYNCGPGNVNKAIRRANSREFWNVYPYLPKETRGYVPAFVAALYTLTYYKEHGIKPLRIEMPAHLDTLQVKQQIHFAQISDCIGISIDELRDLNSQYLRDVIPGKPYVLRLPHQFTPLFVEKEKEIYTYKDSIYFNPVLLAQNTSSSSANRSQSVHTVRSGETLGGIALRYRIKVSDLKYWNNLKSDIIRPGQKLTVYSGQAPARTATATTSASSTQSTASAAANNKSAAATQSAAYQWHTIKKGESLWSIAQSYKVSLNDLMELNGLNKNSKILAGKRLKIPTTKP
ncbi:MAG: LysM peptidoglycan-binding domain-containing protein [Bacteroidetes bacterium]|nr:LysM peptidoglycan-binding domain-containing protein [Bacteroidota bacterium]